jgi:hypothetical protein
MSSKQQDDIEIPANILEEMYACESKEQLADLLYEWCLSEGLGHADLIAALNKKFPGWLVVN